MMTHDIVYLLDNNISDSDELRYSLRSVVKNFPYRKIWFFGGCPMDIEPDEYVEVIQRGENKWERSTSALKVACENDNVTEDFWLFNDDFFVMKKVRNLKPYFNGSLQRQIDAIAANNGGLPNAYSRRLANAMHVLRLKQRDQLNYSIHVPMLINRAKALETMEVFQNPMFRVLYGNYWDIGGEKMDDVKVYDDEYPTNTVFLSTNNDSFRGAVGKYIKGKFKEPCQYEEGTMT